MKNELIDIGNGYVRVINIPTTPSEDEPTADEKIMLKLNESNIKWKESFLKYACHSVGCLIAHEHHVDPCRCGYSELVREIQLDEGWSNCPIGKQPY